MANSDNPLETVQYSKVRDAASRFDEAWGTQTQSTKGIDLAMFLPGPTDPVRLPVLHELIKIDLARRWERGLPISLEDYIEKFPEIGPADKVAARLVYEEYRIRTDHGVSTPLSVYQQRFPRQFPEFETFIQQEDSRPRAATTPGQHKTPSPPGASSNPTSAHASGGSPGPAALNSVSQGTLVGGHYQLIKKIGSGGFGEVWLGTDTHGNIPKAVKIITRSLDSDESNTEKGALEIIKRLNNPFLLRTEGFFAEQDRLMVVMEYADGGSLRDVLKKQKKETKSGIPVDKLLVYMRHTGEALDYLHARGIFHRDIKPENILLVEDMAKVADFGLARLAQNRQSTKTNFAGTGAYSPPETWKGRVTSQSDQYSLAVTYAELRLGRNVYKGSTIYEFMVEHLNSQPNLDPLPQAEQSVILKALAKEPEQRFASCSEFIRELDRAISGGPAMTPMTRSSGDVNLGGMSSKPTATGGLSSKFPSHKSTAPQISQPGWAPPTQARRGRRGGPNVAVAIVLVLVGLGLVVGGLSFLSRRSLDARVQEQVKKLDFKKAQEEVAISGFLAAPYRTGLSAGILERGMELATDAQKSGKFDDLMKICVPLHDAFPKEDKIPTMLERAVKPKLRELTSAGDHATAHALAKDLPTFVTDRESFLDNVRTSWVKSIRDQMGDEKYLEAMKNADKFLVAEPGHREVDVLRKLANASVANNDLVRVNQFKKAFDNLPKSAALVTKDDKTIADNLRKSLKSKWLERGNSQLKADSLEDARDTFVEFNTAFRDDSAGLAGLKEALKGIVEKLIPEKKFSEALNQLDGAGIRFEDLDERVKQEWMKDEVARFKSGKNEAKETALDNLKLLHEKFQADAVIEKEYRSASDVYVGEMMVALATAKPPADRELIRKIEPHVGGVHELPLKSKYLALLLGDSPIDLPKSVQLFHDLIEKNRARAKELGKSLGLVVKVCVRDDKAKDAFMKELLRFEEIADPDSLSPEFYALIGKQPSEESPGRKVINTARRLFDDRQYPDVLRKLSEFNLATEKKNFQLEYQKLHAAATLLATGWQAMPAVDAGWAERLKVCKWADSDDPLVQAIKAEALLETGGKPDFRVVGIGIGEAKGYVDYVRGRLFASQKNDREAALAMEGIDAAGAGWLAPKRKSAATAILKIAALQLTAKTEGRKLFDDADKAERGYKWLRKAMELSDGIEDWTWEALYTLALAAGCRPDPDFEVCAQFGEPMLKTLAERYKKDEDVGGERAYLTLANPRGFRKHVDRLLKDGEVKDYLTKVMAVIGENADRPELKGRLAELYGLKGHFLEGEEAIAAFTRAVELDPESASLQLKKGIAVANFNLKLAAKVQRGAAQLPYLEAGLAAASRAASTPNAASEEVWADFCVRRSELALALGNALYVVDKNDAAPLKSAFEDAHRYATMGLEAKIKHKKPGIVLLAMANAHEDLAYFAAIDPERNFAVAVDYFTKFLAEEDKKDLSYSRGRCKYRWGEKTPSDEASKAIKKKRFDEALLDLSGPADLTGPANHAGFSHQSEAAYFAAFTHWYTFNNSKAVDYFVKSMEAGKEATPPIWAKLSLDGAVLLLETEKDATTDAVIDWLGKIETASRGYQTNDSFAESRRKMAALKIQFANDKEAEILGSKFDVAAKSDFGTAKRLMIRIVELKHSKRHHFDAGTLANFLNAHRGEASSQEINEAYNATIQAITNSTFLSDEGKKSTLSAFKAGFGK